MDIILIFNIFYTIYFENFFIYYIDTIGYFEEAISYKNISFINWRKKYFYKWLYLKIFFGKYYILCVSDNKILYDIAHSISKKLLKLNISYNQKQKSLSLSKRKNIRFTIQNPNNSSNKKILILDDICTSGNTLVEMRKEILKLSPSKIKILCLYKKLWII